MDMERYHIPQPRCGAATATTNHTVAAPLPLLPLLVGRAAAAAAATAIAATAARPVAAAAASDVEEDGVGARLDALLTGAERNSASGEERSEVYGSGTGRLWRRTS